MNLRLCRKKLGLDRGNRGGSDCVSCLREWGGIAEQSIRQELGWVRVRVKR